MDKKKRTENARKERFMYLQTKREKRPDSFGTPETVSVFRKNPFIIKAHYLSRSMLSVKSDRPEKA
jgi:hypothetical protein